MADLFSSGVEERLARRAPLAARLRPRTLDEVVGQAALLGPGRPLRALIEGDRLSSVVLYGPPGTGKTTIARLVAGATDKAFEPLSAVNAGVKEVREVAARARARLGEQGQGTILFLDEVHRFSRTQQDALLPHVEDGLLVLIGATTENPFFSLTGPLLSRSSLFRLEPLDAAALDELVTRGLEDPRGLGDDHLKLDDDARAHLVSRADGDARHVLTSLDVAAWSAVSTEFDFGARARYRTACARLSRASGRPTTSTARAAASATRRPCGSASPTSSEARMTSRRAIKRASSPASSMWASQ